MMNQASYVARYLSRVSSTPSQLQIRRTFFGWFAACPQSPLTAEIEDTLDNAFQPSFLKVHDESDKFYS
jgi:stress-induced morphogen